MTASLRIRVNIVSVIRVELTVRIVDSGNRLVEGKERKMRKTIIGNRSEAPPPSTDEWFGIDAIAGIEVTSEAKDAPVESVFDAAGDIGWRAGDSGPQVIRITFSEPKTIGRIQLEFREQEIERTQEFTLHSTADRGQRTEVIRQQWTFSPQGSTQEVEEYRLNLSRVVILELTINPDLNHGSAPASLLRLRIG